MPSYNSTEPKDTALFRRVNWADTNSAGTVMIKSGMGKLAGLHIVQAGNSATVSLLDTANISASGTVILAAFSPGTVWAYQYPNVLFNDGLALLSTGSIVGSVFYY